MLRQTMLPLLLFVAVLATGVAQADSVRVPKTGVPAFAFDTPAGWTILYDEFGNLRLTADDHTCALQLSIISDPAIGKTPLSELAAQIMKAAEARPFSKQSPGTIAGRKGTQFFSQITNEKGVAVTLGVTLVKLDASHVASQATMKAEGMSHAQIAALNALIARVRLTGVK